MIIKNWLVLSIFAITLSASNFILCMQRVPSRNEAAESVRPSISRNSSPEERRLVGSAMALPATEIIQLKPEQFYGIVASNNAAYCYICASSI